MITNYTVNPEILMPGDTATLSILLTNTDLVGTTTTTTTIGNTQTVETSSAKVTIENIWLSDDGDGSYFIKADNYYNNLGELSAGTSANIQFELTTDEYLRVGTYVLYLHVLLDEDSIKDLSFPIPIKISNNTLEVTKQSIPSTLSTIGETSVSLLVINNRMNALNGVSITPQTSDSYEIYPETLYFSSMAAESTQEVTFHVHPLKQSPIDLFFDITYLNGVNQHHSSVNFSLSVSDMSDIGLLVYEIPTVASKDQSVEARLKVFNGKDTELSSVIVIPETDALVTPSEYFIGSMDANDIFAVSFEVDSSQLHTNQTYPLSFKVGFMQNGNYYETQTTSASFTVIEQSTSNGTVEIVGAAALIVIVLFIIILWYRRKRRKE